MDSTIQVIPLQTDQASIAAINANITYIQRDVSNINLTLKDLNNMFASKEQVADIITQFDQRIARIEKQGNLWKYLSPILSAAGALVMGFLIESYLRVLK